jgi:hypothetical protein
VGELLELTHVGKHRAVGRAILIHEGDGGGGVTRFAWGELLLGSWIATSAPSFHAESDKRGIRRGQ